MQYKEGDGSFPSAKVHLIYLFLAVPNLHCCLRAFCSGERGLLSSCGM